MKRDVKRLGGSMLAFALGACMFYPVPCKATVAADVQESPLVSAWDFEGDKELGKISDKSGNNQTGTVLKADLSYCYGVGAPSEGWGFAKWEDFDEDIPVVYDVGRNSNVFFTKGLYEIEFDSADFFNEFNDYSFSAWVKFADVPMPQVNPYTKSAWLFKADNRMGQNASMGFAFDFGFAGQQTVYQSPVMYDQCLHTSNYMLTKSNWINFTFSITKGVYRLYIDGELTELVRSGKGSDDAITYAGAGVTPVQWTGSKIDSITVGGGQQVGPQFGGWFRPANIFLDNVCFYNRGLTQEEVKTVVSGNYALTETSAEIEPESSDEEQETVGCSSSVAMGSLSVIVAAAAITILMIRRGQKDVE